MLDKERRFLGTYFERDSVIRWSKVIAVLAWVVAGIYALDLVATLGTMGLQYARGFMVGMGFTDWVQQIIFLIKEKLLHGVLYFGILQGVSQGLLIGLDVEENTRRRGGDPESPDLAAEGTPC